MTINTNALHNLLNVALAIIGALAVFDWTVFGFSSVSAVKIVGGLTLGTTILKLLINAFRDGPAGMVKEQPPVR